MDTLSRLSHDSDSEVAMVQLTQMMKPFALCLLAVNSTGGTKNLCIPWEFLQCRIHISNLALYNRSDVFVSSSLKFINYVIACVGCRSFLHISFCLDIAEDATDLQSVA